MSDRDTVSEVGDWGHVRLLLLRLYRMLRTDPFTDTPESARDLVTRVWNDARARQGLAP